MTKRELNRDVKRLLKRYKVYQKTEGYNQDEHASIMTEFRRLYNADNTFSSLTKTNVLIMLRINLSIRAVALHHFGLSIEI